LLVRKKDLKETERYAKIIALYTMF